MYRIALLLFFVFSISDVFAQAADRLNAQLSFKKAEKSLAENDFANAEVALREAKSFIDKAYSINTNDYKTLFYRAQIYSSLPLLTLVKPQNQEACFYTSFKSGADVKSAIKEQDANFDIALISYEQALKSASINISFKEDIIEKLRRHNFNFSNCAIQSYQEKDFAASLRLAAKAIKAYEIMGKVDTLDKWVTALSHEALGDYPNAIKEWKSLIALKYQGAKSYKSLARVYTKAKMNTNAESILAEAKKNYPKDF